MSVLALQLIEKEKKEKTGMLDLGMCGLTDFPSELFELTWLEELSLSNRVWSREEEKWTKSDNKGPHNLLKGSLPNKFKVFTSLKKLSISDDNSGNLCITEASVLGEISGLQTLNLSSNQISDIRFLVKLTRLQSLYLSRNQISDIRSLMKLTGLQRIDLSHNQINHIRFQEKLTGLQSLNLSNNQINDIRFLKKLAGLQSLDLSHNQINDIRFLHKLTGLQSLDLSHNQISDIRFPEKLTGLHSLDLSLNQISDTRFLEKLTGLQHLDLRGNKISDIRFLEKLTCLQHLYLRGNKISDIRFLEKLPGLQSLDLGSNQISDIRFLEKHTSLQSLDLRFNQISDIRFLEKLTGLQYLDLSSNQINDIHFLEKLTGLQRLYLIGNKISDIRSLGQLTGIQNLNLSSNQISDIRFLEKLSGLQSLDLSYNEISDYSFLENLPGLQSLDLRANKISDIRFLEKLTGLQRLDLRNNQISDIRFLEKLTGLQRLDLRTNQIDDIRFLEKLTGLRRLDLRTNQISDIRPLIPLLEKRMNIALEESRFNQINLHENPIATPPIEIVKQGREAVLNYFEELDREQTFPLLEAKLLIIGAGGVGKTSLMMKLLDVDNKLPKVEDTTIGITVSDLPKRFFMEEMEYTLHIWDFGGQDIYHPTHQFFLTKNSIYILMQDGREQKTDFYYWLQVQELLAANSPLFIIQNIKNNNRCSIPINELRGKFGNIKDYFEIDLSEVTKGFKNFEHIEAIIQATEKGLPQIGELWPATRFAIRDELISIRDRNYISYDEYQEICNRYDYTDFQRQRELLQQLHELGTVLHFRDTAVLEEIVITNPQWVTDAVYEILNHTKKHYEKQGHFTWRDLKKVWSDDKYRDVYFEILNLMEKFELCFELPDEQYTYIAPLLLPDDQPVYPWDEKGTLQMSYSYDFMPKGIMARLIVRLHTQIKEQLFWKRGMVLEHNNTRAQITEDYTSKNISISVQGQHAKKLIHLIYTSIDEINSTYYFSKRMKATKQVPCNCSVCRKSETPNFYDFEKLQVRIQKNRQSIECDISFEDVNVKLLLENITPVKAEDGEAPTKLFISYAHKDNKYKEELEEALAVQKRINKVQIWSDREILAGEKWNDKIEHHLRQADIIVLFISSAFFASDYIWDKELPIIQELYDSKAAHVMPVLVRESDWIDTPFSKFQAVPTEPDTMQLLPISQWEDPDTAWNIVVKSIKKLI